MSLPKNIVLSKRRGQTPLETIEAWRAEHPELAGVPTSYAGRLDPMAEGKLLVLIGEECKRQAQYTKLDKEYVIEVLLDLHTDTGDALGMPAYEGKETNAMQAEINAALRKERGAHSRKYPIYSSKTVKGKPLFVYALEGTVGDIEVPEHIENIYSIRMSRVDSYSSAEIAEKIKDALAIVPRSDEPSKALGADFRQDAIRSKWKELFEAMPNRRFHILRLRVTCGAGAYMRTLAERIGVSLGTHALALSIRRTRIGKFMPVGPAGFWVKNY